MSPPQKLVVSFVSLSRLWRLTAGTYPFWLEGVEGRVSGVRGEGDDWTNLQHGAIPSSTQTVLLWSGPHIASVVIGPEGVGCVAFVALVGVLLFPSPRAPAALRTSSIVRKGKMNGTIIVAMVRWVGSERRS